VILVHFFAIEIKLNTLKSLFQQLFTFEKKQIQNKYEQTNGHFGKLKIISKTITYLDARTWYAVADPGFFLFFLIFFWGGDAPPKKNLGGRSPPRAPPPPPFIMFQVYF
jgi:hypothetical protein